MTTPDFAPLRGKRVIEVSHMIFGPSAGYFLAALGADVIKIEPPGGDKTRRLTGMGAAFFPAFNRGKRSVSLDMDCAEGRQAFETLLVTADILVENFRDSSLAAMGLDPATLQAQHPGLIVVACKGFLNGPYRNRSALDEVVQMMTGLAYMTGPPGQPLRTGASVNDIMGGLFGALAVLGALYQRCDDAPDAQPDTAPVFRIGLFENSMFLVTQHMVQYALQGVEPEPMPSREFTWPVYDIFQTADERSVFVGAVTEGQWQTLCTLLDLQTLLEDPRLAGRMDRIAARNWTLPIIARAVATMTAATLMRRLEKEGIPFAPVTRPAELYTDPQAQAGGGLPTTHLPDGRHLTMPGLPIEINGDRLNRDLDVPASGADTNEILHDLGFDEGFIARARGRDGAAS